MGFYPSLRVCNPGITAGWPWGEIGRRGGLGVIRILTSVGIYMYMRVVLIRGAVTIREMVMEWLEMTIALSIQR